MAIQSTSGCSETVTNGHGSEKKQHTAAEHRSCVIPVSFIYEKEYREMQAKIKEVTIRISIPSGEAPKNWVYSGARLPVQAVTPSTRWPTAVQTSNTLPKSPGRKKAATPAAKGSKKSNSNIFSIL